ncbi:FHA domain-containing protein [Thermanaerothrix daxensis]|uniref:FHA domain-containing protein n=1 Tax=Thermanaerothrix daxensis TaxID=869279 RepID=UPI0006C9005D|nr:FHA domain-containing protein [Thermanaerothrix daxensis]
MGFRLEKLESRLRALVEDYLGRVPWRGREEDWSRRLYVALQTALLNQPTGRPLPDLCVIEVSPSLYATWHQQTDWQAPLIQALKDVANEVGFTFLGNPQILLRACADLGEDEIRVHWKWGEEIMGETAVLDFNEPSHAHAQPPRRAFLIVQGKDVFPLEQSVISIGRHSDNMLVLPDLRVSRHHAQIRCVGERYVLFDLNSTGGTYVNGERVTRWELQPGDVISLAGVSLIYGEENQPDAAAETRPMDSE